MSGGRVNVTMFRPDDRQFERNAELLLVDLLRLKARLRRELRRVGRDHFREFIDFGGEA